MSDQVYILSGCRTAVGRFQGQFEKFSASELGSIVIGESLNRANLTPEDVDEVIMGQVLTAGQGQNTGRQAAVGAKIPYSVPAFTVNMLCGSGLKTICLAYQAIKNKDCQIIVAGGQENMTRAQHSSYIRGSKLGSLPLQDTLMSDGLTDAFNNIPMGNTAEHLAKEYKISRSSQDEFSEQSQLKACKAIKEEHFKKEIVAVLEKRSGKPIENDEHPKPDTTAAALAKLRPAFDPVNGTVTAGNASGINDGAAAVVLCSQNETEKRNLKPWAKIIAFAEVGVDPMKMGLGPIDAVKRVLAKSGWTKDDVDLYELNEAFAVQSIIVVDSLQLDKAKVNISGGAIALGHPIGASGARVLVTLLHNLERLGKRKGVASLCIGGGMGIAIAVERC